MVVITSPGRSRRLRPLLAVLVPVLVSGVLVAPPAVAGVTPSAGSDGYGDSYFPLDGNGGIDVTHYRIRDRYRFGRRVLSGTTTLRVEATQDLSSFNLDLLLAPRAVKVDGMDADFDKPQRHELAITPATPLLRGQEFTVRVSYRGRPGPIAYDGEQNWLADDHEVVAMNQPHMAPWWFASNDHPDDKALMDISITVPRGKRVVANGNRVSRERHGRLATHHWRADEPMATYLAMFAAGPFHVEKKAYDGTPVRLYVSKRLPDRQYDASLKLVRRTPRLLGGLASDLGPYPFSSAGGLVTSLPVGFALENQTIPTYFPVGSAHGWNPLVVHEQAHQWFGDSVAIERWRDIWLNEGAATFMEKRYKERIGVRSAADWLQRSYRGHPLGDSLWNVTIADPGAARIFSTAVYLRGGMTFQALRNRIGEDDFWTLLRTWLRDHRDGNGSTAEFEELAASISGRNLDGFFDAWLHSASRPAETRRNGLVTP